MKQQLMLHQPLNLNEKENKTHEEKIGEIRMTQCLL